MIGLRSINENQMKKLVAMFICKSFTVTSKVKTKLRNHHIFTYSADTTASPVTKTERSSTLVGETPQLEVRVSAAFNSAETDKKLQVPPFPIANSHLSQTSTHTVVAKDEEPTDSSSKEDATDYEKVRDGPSAAALDVFVKGDKDLAFTNKNLEVTSNSSDYYKLSYAKGNVAVNGGKWYYEVRIQISGQMQLGWASTSYNPKVNLFSLNFH